MMSCDVSPGWGASIPFRASASNAFSAAFPYAGSHGEITCAGTAIAVGGAEMMDVEATASALAECWLHQIARGRHPGAVVIATPAVVRIGVKIGANIATGDRARRAEDLRFAFAGVQVE